MENKKILVVDDSKTMQQVLEEILTQAGYNVVKAGNGAEAMQLARKERPDLIMLDLIMPDMDGSEVAARLKDSPQTQNIPIIYLSALITKNEEDKIRNVVGASSIILAKPVDTAELLGAIEKIL